MKPTELLVPAEVVTVTASVLRVARGVLLMVAVIVVEFTTTTLVTPTPPPWIATPAPGAKFAPVSVTFTNVPRLPAFGEIELIAGFCVWVVAAFTVNVCAPLVPALVDTTMLCPPVDAPEAIESTTLICDALTILAPLTLTPDPPIDTAAPDWKFAPVSVTDTFVPCVPLFGEIALSTGAAAAGALIVTVAEPTAVVVAVLVACTITVPPAGTAVGAVYKPPLVIVPTVALPPATPFTAQVTPWLLAFATDALNC